MSTRPDAIATRASRGDPSRVSARAGRGPRPRSIESAPHAAERLAAEYVLPLRWPTFRSEDVAELTDYLTGLTELIDVTVVDGSPAPVFTAHHSLWAGRIRHVPPDSRPRGNGKVAGVMTGVRLARHRAVIVADDDVRYDKEGLERMVAELQGADVVRPQNFFTRLPWHARLDTARSLLNRAVASDYPGTLGVNRDLLLTVGGYAGDVLFENLELIRTVRAAGGTERRIDDLFVGRIPPSPGHFARQRVRQAYDDFAQPGRLAVELALLPTLVWAMARPVRVGVLAVAACALAEVGRRRSNGRQVFPSSTSLWAPLWMLERAVCVWVAVGARMLGGAKYGGGRIRKAAHSVSALRRNLGAMSSSGRARIIR